MVYKDVNKRSLLQLLNGPIQFIMVFYIFCYCFSGKHSCWTETNILVTIVCFYNIPLPCKFWTDALPANTLAFLTTTSPALYLFQATFLLQIYIHIFKVTSNHYMQFCSEKWSTWHNSKCIVKGHKDGGK